MVVIPLNPETGAKVTSPFVVFAVHVPSGFTFMLCGSDMRVLRSIEAGSREFPDPKTRSFARIFVIVTSPVP